MLSPFAGANVWIWELGNCDGGDYDTIARRVLDAGGRGVYVKASDGINWYPQFQVGSKAIVPISTIVAELRKRGLIVCTWSYHYGTDPLAEAQLVVDTINIAQPDGHIFDVEQEFEDQPGPAGRATALLTTIRAGIPAGFPLAYAPQPSIRNHLAAPYRQFTDAGCAMIPQTYFNALHWTPDQTIARFYTDAAQYQLLTQPVFPAYGDFAEGATQRPSDADVARFVELIRAQQAIGCSVWSYQHLDAGGRQRFSTVAASFQPVHPPKPVMTNNDIIAAERFLLAEPSDPSGAIIYLQQFV